MESKATPISSRVGPISLDQGANKVLHHEANSTTDTHKFGKIYPIFDK